MKRAGEHDGSADILSLLLACTDEQGQGLSDDELHDELLTLLFAGHETTATALTWAFHWLHRTPAVRDRLLEELQTLPEPADPDAIARLPYLPAVVNEVLRIHPVMFCWSASRPCTNGPTFIPSRCASTPIVSLGAATAPMNS